MKINLDCGKAKAKDFINHFPIKRFLGELKQNQNLKAISQIDKILIFRRPK